ncbi:hypothetical protein FMM05_18240 [Flavobacterium zepuense]|uniref:Lipoprotein n=1 Tax=Flavobacterium zepuense TaxID=2593302 RepID=A0A552UV59_9FLAO|nr:hypothetical protein [Flavobacterium zepuense]TRW22128.1 hypothetical protein FMM05_18240 [Flavobacterium zepuense]
MRKLLLLLATLCIIASCSVDGNDPQSNFHVEFIPTISVEMPEHVTPGYTYAIKLYYQRPTDCYVFDGFYYDIDATNNARVVAIQSKVFEQNDCVAIEGSLPEVATLNFECPTQYTGTAYTFKFYKGLDANGNQEFLEVEVPITEQ